MSSNALVLVVPVNEIDAVLLRRTKAFAEALTTAVWAYVLEQAFESCKRANTVIVAKDGGVSAVNLGEIKMKESLDGLYVINPLFPEHTTWQQKARLAFGAIQPLPASLQDIWPTLPTKLSSAV